MLRHEFATVEPYVAELQADAETPRIRELAAPLGLVTLTSAELLGIDKMPPSTVNAIDMSGLLAGLHQESEEADTLIAEVPVEAAESDDLAIANPMVRAALQHMMEVTGQDSPFLAELYADY